MHDFYLNQNDENIEDKYLDVLMKIEQTIVRTHKKNQKLIDKEVVSALDAVIKDYKKSNPKASIQMFPDGELQELYTRLKETSNLILEAGTHTREEILSCLKRILKSVKMWNEMLGRQGYLTFIQNYVH